MQIVKNLQEAKECLEYAEIRSDEAIYATNGKEYAIGTIASLTDLKKDGSNKEWKMCDNPF